MNLTIDIGNTRIKAGVFNGTKLIANCTVAPASLKELEAFIKKHAAKAAIVSSTTEYPKGLKTFLKGRFKLVELSEKTRLPFKNNYKTPKTLGKDRLAAVAGALHLLPKKDVLVIDAGTCVTYDFMDKKGVYHGGGISPGLNMRFYALYTFTGRLPLIQPDNTFTELTGKTTEESILTGVQQGMIEEIDGFINAYKKRHPTLQVILSGGSSQWLKQRLKNKIISEPFLTLQGLNVLLAFHFKGTQPKHIKR
jgi:type III pantothenate kinase